MNTIVIGIIIGTLFISLLLLFFVVLIKLYFTKIKNYTQKLYQKDIDFQKSLTETIVETQEQVLNNISQDLHDDAGQQLTYINFQIENLKFDSPELQQQLEPISQSISNLSQSIRSISHSLNHQLLLQQDLLKAIQTEVERMQKNDLVKFHLELDNSGNKKFSTNEKIVIYRIFQEIINNAFKHSKAKNIRIEIKTKPHFFMEITDDGKGFDVSKKGQTLGLQNLKARAKLIEYDITIQSAINHGTTITLTQNQP
ncbi:sensor histidine kinase [Flavobacterium dankookense]|uniref:histidine kinase n=1 Tax=Flavobacterium dankookense TaxID=706186 RepID=A0A4R6QHF7_9FLAO|nr:ATP-binding protein [Flavobacterium dankookense]TDP61019.1 histidine kinase/DNA gyrase B/HSP90-like ATPase [Flavobacterium dankookense]